MNPREEVHHKVKLWIDENVEDKKQAWHYGKMELHRDIDRIYDNFESRKCESCKFSWEDDKYKHLKCGYINEDNMKDCSGHYCGQWESK